MYLGNKTCSFHHILRENPSHPGLHLLDVRHFIYLNYALFASVGPLLDDSPISTLDGASQLRIFAGQWSPTTVKIHFTRPVDAREHEYEKHVALLQLGTNALLFSSFRLSCFPWRFLCLRFIQETEIQSSSVSSVPIQQPSLSEPGNQQPTLQETGNNENGKTFFDEGNFLQATEGNNEQSAGSCCSKNEEGTDWRPGSRILGKGPKLAKQTRPDLEN